MKAALSILALMATTVNAVPTCGEYTTEDTSGAFPSSSCTGTRVYDSTKEDATSPSDANCCKAAPLE